jgi:hypothetical protein
MISRLDITCASVCNTLPELEETDDFEEKGLDVSELTDSVDFFDKGGAPDAVTPSESCSSPRHSTSHLHLDKQNFIILCTGRIRQG